MYEENKRFSWTNFLIKLIIFVIFILFVMWLLSLSTKGLSNSLNVLTDKVMTENLERMKEVGREYFTIERLPSKVGDVEKITLKEMYDKHLILEIKDQNGESCSTDKSYVSVEKLETEYEMKVYLECGEESNYIVSVMGCNDLCGSDTCEVKKEEEEKTPISNTTTTKKLEYQYSLTIPGSWSDYGTWSNWTTTPIASSVAKQVETKTENQAYTYTVTVTNVIDYDYLKSCPTGYTMSSDGTNCYKNSTTTTTVPSCPSTYNGYTLVSQSGLTCNYSKNVTSTTDYKEEYKSTKTFIQADVPNVLETENYIYKYQTQRTELDCSNSCKTVTYYVYDYYEKVYTTSTSTTKTTLSCPSGYTYSNNSCRKTSTSYVSIIKTCPTGTNVNAEGTGCYKKVSTDEIRTGYKEVTYYRYRTRTYTEGTTVYKWSSSKNDKTLLNAGYKLTGKTRNK